MAKSGAIALAAAFVGGALLGATAGLLFAPEKGEDQRKKIKDALAKRGIRLDKAGFDSLVEELKGIGKKSSADAAEDYDVE